MRDLPDLPDQPLQKTRLRRPFLYSIILAVAVAVYVAFVLFSRWDSSRAIERRNAEKAAAERHANDMAALQELGGSRLTIRAFYLSPASIYTGQSSQLCYDVSNAKTVTVNPPVGAVWPSHNRCLGVSPPKSTTYTITAADDRGQTATQSVELKVREHPPIHVKSFPSQ